MIQGPKSKLRKSLLAIAVSTALMGAAPAVFAQTNVVGSIIGTDVDPGSEVTLVNADTGASRTATADSNGRFQISALPPGVYSAELSSGGRSVAKRNGVLVTIGSATSIDFTAEELEEVLVTGARSDIEMSSTDTRTVFTAEDLEKLTVGLSIEDVTLLAPGTVRGDSRYATARGRSSVSFGGAGANENAFYINGYAVTDPVKGLGSSSLPFDGIAQMQLLTGGYGAEFGRSTGGVVNIVTKRGTNQWKAGAMMTYAPGSLEGSRHDSWYTNPGTAQFGTLWSENSRREIGSTLFGGYVGGPVIQDKLFIYLSGELEKRDDNGPRNIRNTSGTSALGGTDGWFDRSYDVPRWLAKVDWNIADGHTLEFTGISDVQKQKREYYGYYYTATNAEGLPASTKGTSQNGGIEYKDGGETYIAKYTGTLTDNLIFTGLYGRSKNVQQELPIGYDPSVVPVRDTRSTVPVNLNVGPFQTLRDPDAHDKSDGYRLDLEWLLGRHDVRVGYDVQNLEIYDATVTAGPEGYMWIYDNTNTNPIEGSGGAVNPGGNGEYVTRTVSIRGGNFEAEQYAYFLEDRWQISDNMMLSLGVRNENFKNYSADGTLFLGQTNQWAPRLGISYDLKGDGQTRLFANAGRYHLAIPLYLAFRQVGAATNTDEYFSFTSIDPATGIPQGLTPLGSGPFSNNGEYGQARDPSVVAAQGLKGYFQDEFAVGVESKLFGSFVGGARFTYRNLASQIDDSCDPRPAYNWAVQNGHVSGVDASDLFHNQPVGNGLDDGAEFIANQLYHCMIINPGEANTLKFNVGTADNPVYELAEISAAEMGLPKMKRSYVGVDLFLEHPLRNGWYGKLDWTISRSKGNAEGQLLSDIGQADVAVSLNWDHPELMANASGSLPNDRKHQIKAFGFYQLAPQWRVSSTITAASGRPKSATGSYGGDPLVEIINAPGDTCDTQCFYDDVVDYGGLYYRYIDGAPSPRGRAGRLPWTAMLDVGVSYAPDMVRGLTLGLDVFNVLNQQRPQNTLDIAQSGTTPYHSFNKVVSYNTPRTVRFGVRYSWGQ